MIGCSREVERVSVPRALNTFAAARGGVFRNDNNSDIRRILKDRLEMPESRIRWGLHPDGRACSDSFKDADCAGNVSSRRSPNGTDFRK